MRTQSVQTIQCWVRSRPRWRVIAPGRGLGRARADSGPQHTPYWRAQGHHCRRALPEPHGSVPAVYKIKPLFRARAKGRALTPRRPTEQASGRLVCAAGAAGPAPAATSNAPQIKGAAARSASVIIIMQALRGARDSGERATRAARAPPPGPAHPPPVNGIDTEQNDRPSPPAGCFSDQPAVLWAFWELFYTLLPLSFANIFMAGRTELEQYLSK